MLIQSVAIVLQNIQLDKDLEQQEQKLARFGQENAEMKLKVEELESENKNLEKGMKEIHQAIKEQGETLQR